MTRTPLSLFLCLCVSLVLALAGVQGALACPKEPVVAVAACGHDGLIWLDASGQPAKTCAHCPDCSPAPALPSASPRAPAWHPLGAERLLAQASALSRPAPQPCPGARAPPSGA